MDKVELGALRRAVGTVPNKIRELARQLQEQTGIKIREESVKLTPAFMRRLLRNAAKEGQPGFRKARKENLMLGPGLVSPSALVPSGIPDMVKDGASVSASLAPLHGKHGVGVNLQKGRERSFGD
ncbi:hypothetical protein HDU93_005107, partial [Gonapodya sp. JEL0774]